MRLCRAVRKFNPDFIYERYNLFFFGGLSLKWIYGLPFHLEINSPLAQERATNGQLAFKRLAARLEHYNWRNADCTYPVTGVIADRIVALGISKATIIINQNGVDLARYRPAAPRQPSDGEIVLGFVGFMRRWHGLNAVISLLAAVADAPRLKLVLVGDGPARQELEEQAHALGVSERVEFLGVVQRDRVPEIVGSFDIALHAKGRPIRISVEDFRVYGPWSGHRRPRPTQHSRGIVSRSGRSSVRPERRESHEGSDLATGTRARTASPSRQRSARENYLSRLYLGRKRQARAGGRNLAGEPRMPSAHQR